MMADRRNFDADESYFKKDEEILTTTDKAIIELINRRRKERKAWCMDGLTESSNLQKEIVIASVDRLVDCGILIEGTYAGRTTYKVSADYSIPKDDMDESENNESFIDRCFMEIGLKKIKEQMIKEVKVYCKSEISALNSNGIDIDIPTHNSGNQEYINSLEATLKRLESDIIYLKQENSSKQNTINILLE